MFSLATILKTKSPSLSTQRLQNLIGWLPSSILFLLAAHSSPVLAQKVLVDESFTNPALNPVYAPNWKYSTRDPANSALEPPCLTAANVQPSPPSSGTGFVPGCRTGATGLTDAQGGALRLTSSKNDQASFIFYNQAIPAGQGLQIIFDFYAYGGKEFQGRRGDGISFFLVDGAANPNTAGAFGGSLGYAQKTAINGIEGGYVGIGFDEFGNYSNPSEGRQGGPGIRIDAVALRGKGDNTTGYAYLNGTGSLPGSIDSLNANANRAGSKRTARITLTADNKISVDIDFGSGFQPVITPYDLATQGTLPSAGFKFGFASSTGAATNIHEIRNLLITTLSPNLSITKSHTGNFTVGQNGEYTLKVKNSPTASSTIGPITVTDTLPPGLNFVSGGGTNWNCSAIAQTVTCTYTGSKVTAGQTLPDLKLTVSVTNTVGTKVTNSATVTTPEDSDTTDNTASDETAIITSSLLTASKSAALVDANGDGVANPGEVITYTITLNSVGTAPLTNTVFTDAIPANTSYVPNSTTLNNIVIADVGGNMPFANGALVNSPGEPNGQINPGKSAIASFQVKIANPLPANVTQISNQGTVKSDQVTQSVATDDLTIPGTADPTITPIAQGEANLLLVKRITAVKRDNQVSLFKSFVNDPAETNDDAVGWNQLLPVGVPRLGQDQPLKSGDEVEYTIYFLAEGNRPITNAKVCDLIPTGTTFIQDNFEPGKGILLNQDGAETVQTNNILDADPGKFFPAMNPVTAPCSNANNPTGAIFVNLGNLSNPNPKIGFIRFRVKID